MRWKSKTNLTPMSVENYNENASVLFFCFLNCMRLQKVTSYRMCTSSSNIWRLRQFKETSLQRPGEECFLLLSLVSSSLSHPLSYCSSSLIRTFLDNLLLLPLFILKCYKMLIQQVSVTSLTMWFPESVRVLKWLLLILEYC